MRADAVDRVAPGPELPGAARARAPEPALRRLARRRIEEALRRPIDPRALRVLTLPAPVSAPAALLRPAQVPGALQGLAGAGLHAVLWQPPQGGARCGLGAAWEAAVEGPGRIEQLLARLAELGTRLVSDGRGEAPRLFGGLAFATGWRGPEPGDRDGERAAPWRAFGDGRFFLPRWCYGRDGERAFLQLALRGADEAALLELDQIWAALEAPEEPEETPAILSIAQADPARWREHVAAILTVLRRGGCDKIVAARRAVATAAAPLPDHAVLARLLREQPGCTVFALRCGAASFLGATPERLVSRRGAEVRTEALAGTCDARGAEGTLDNDKDRVEHELVVRDILARLGPLCAELPAPPAPTPRRLRDVLHLHTPIAGRLAGPRHVLELVRALHPTPAVAGAPAAEAQRWIVAHEPDPRGWYAGPVGWLDARGDGDFVVALRSALLEGPRAHLYAGAGVVPSSDADREYAETALKQRALLSALGGEP